MKTISVSKNIKNKLDNFLNGKSVNKKMKVLVESAEKYEKYESKKGSNDRININMDDEIFSMFLKCKKYSNESHSDTIERLLDEYNQKQ